jgi:hypothetical protein
MRCFLLFILLCPACGFAVEKDKQAKFNKATIQTEPRATLFPPKVTIEVTKQAKVNELAKYFPEIRRPAGNFVIGREVQARMIFYQADGKRIEIGFNDELWKEAVSTILMISIPSS